MAAGNKTPSIRPCYMCASWPPEQSTNGVVTYTFRLTQALQELGEHPSVLAYTGTPNAAHVKCLEIKRSLQRRIIERASRWLAIRTNPLLASDAALQNALNDMHRRGEIGIFEIEESFGTPALSALKTPVPTVVRLHGPWALTCPANGEDPESPANRRRIAFEKKAIAAAHGVTAPSYSVLEKTRSYFGLELPDAVVIPNPAPNTPADLRWKASQTDWNKILYVGRIDNAKGADTAIQAFILLAATRPALQLLLCGPDSDIMLPGGGYGSYKSFLTDSVTDASIRKRIHFKGRLPEPKLAELRQNCGCTLMASRFETFSNVVVESMISGAPIVATACGGPQELIRDGYNGLLATPGDATSLAAKLEQLLQCKETAARMGQQACVDASRKYDATTIATDSLEFYKSVLGKMKK